MMVISPDEGGMGRAVFFANVLGLDLGMFYKRRDYTKIINGRNPIVAHEFLGASVEGKDVIIVDDMISSGESMLDTAKELKRMKARKVFICTTFGLFTGGLKKFDEYYENGIIDRVLTTNPVSYTHLVTIMESKPNSLNQRRINSCSAVPAFRPMIPKAFMTAEVSFEYLVECSLASSRVWIPA